MHIEALVRGKVMTRAEIPDEDLELPGAPWQRAVQYREEVIRLQLLNLERKLEKFYQLEVPVEFCLVFRSKMHSIDEQDNTTTTDGNSDLRIDELDAPGDHPDAE